MREPKIPITGEKILAQHIADIIRWVKSIVPRGDGKTIQIKTTPGGSLISSFASSGGGELLWPVMLKTKVNYNTYIGDVYGAGINEEPTEKDVTVKILAIDTNETIPSLGGPFAIYVAWQQTWGDDFFLTCQPEIAR